MKDFLVLKLLDKISFIFKVFNIDYKLMRKLLQVKLIMDGRRVPTILVNNKAKEESNIGIKSLLMYMLMGIFIGFVIVIDLPLFLKMNLVLGLIIFMTMTTMVSDFSSIILDIQDRNIIAPRPVDNRTLSAAKLIHIFINLFKVTMSISAASLVISYFKHGPVFTLIFFLQLLLISGFILFFTSLLYFIILSMFDGEKLKDIINYFQIALTVFMTVGYQFMGRIFGTIGSTIQYSPKWWHFLIPSTWFAAPYSLIFEKHYESSYMVFTIISILIPAASFILYFKFIIPYFEKNLQKLAENSENKKKGFHRKIKRQRSISKIFSKNKVQNSFFRFTENMITTERKIKLRIYPSLAFAVVFPFIFIMNEMGRNDSFNKGLQGISSGNYHLYIYLSVLMLANTFPIIYNSEKYKGAWIYRAMPMEKPAPIYKGALKAYIFKFVVPVYLILSLIFLTIYGFKIILDLIVIFLNLLLFIILIFHFTKKELPFYKDFDNDKRGGIVIMMCSFAYVGASAIIHNLAIKYTFGTTIYGTVILLLLFVYWNISFRVTWEEVFKGN